MAVSRALEPTVTPDPVGCVCRSKEQKLKKNEKIREIGEFSE
ncbi:hypothetical protein BRCON_2028 [Candidatus Sumerlaea chitinivorans]|uniref:Uncharacterized protein n=1 Tax=Sumerlaea chitinivorans TaxID=2250252 RepID=A0A2Z4Y8P4_SUMC1|nr:hypothetical protein BRCON_2028 [Candidatus Sumerlaea chitinivorans]